MFTSRLAEQRARLVVMLRRGDLPEELQNEKIVELHLQKKQVCVTMIIDHYYLVSKFYLRFNVCFGLFQMDCKTCHILGTVRVFTETDLENSKEQNGFVFVRETVKEDLYYSTIKTQL